MVNRYSIFGIVDYKTPQLVINIHSCDCHGVISIGHTGTGNHARFPERVRDDRQHVVCGHT